MSKPSRVIVLLEDDRHKMLVRRYLTRRGFREHEIRIQQVGPAVCVLRRFATEVSAYRNRQARVQTALIVVIDADTGTVQQRLRQLDEALGDSGKPPVDVRTEKIARLVPKRNIETWILCLNGYDVDEETDYKGARHDWTELIRPAAGTLHEWTESEVLPTRCAESLRSGIRELKRLET